MRLTHKILIPLVMMLALLAGMSIALFVHLRQQQVTLTHTSRLLVGMIDQTSQMRELQEKIRIDVLAYRFDRKQSRLDAIVRSDREIAGAFDSYAAIVGAGQGRDLLQALMPIRNQIVHTRRELIRTIQAGDDRNTRLVFDKWALLNKRLDAHLEDLSAFSVITLEKTVGNVAQDQITFVRRSLYGIALAIAIVFISYLYLRRDVGRRFALLLAGIEGIGPDRLGARVDPRLERSTDEIGGLARAFNDMADRISTSHAALLGQVTERTHAQEALRQLNAELEQRVVERTAKLEIVNRELESFSYSVSHDLRSPLRAIDGFSRILEEDYAGKLDDEGRRLLNVIRDNSRKMAGLIDDLLEFSQLGRKSLSTAAINMKRLVEEVVGKSPVSGEKPPRLLLGALPSARGDTALVKQVWVNLLENAIKFSGKRGEPVIEVSGYENGAENIYCVKDNGAGFDMKYADKLFGVFQRLHSAAEFSGTGVGLAIVQRIVTRHGGRAWAEGKVDEGAAFYFSLPKEKPDGRV